MSRRASGILLHPTCLPGPCGIGDFGDGAHAFLDWLVAAGQQYWQVLPLGPTGLGDSPYNAVSAFAGNPLLISSRRLVDEGLLTETATETPPPSPADRIRFPQAREWKQRVLRRSWSHFRKRQPKELRTALRHFIEAPEQAGWLDDWALYSATKAHFDGEPWHRWPIEIRRREPRALAELTEKLDSEIAFERYLQFLFHRQWLELKAEAHRRNVSIFGDLPIYVALDSAEVWSKPHLFCLDASGRPLKVAGVPPDYFSTTGQRWGNPLYMWDRMADDGYSWWIERLRANLRLVDLLRLDHFRGFAAYWEIDAQEPTAEKGRWAAGPGLDFFQAIESALGKLPLVAEDLGVITSEVRNLRRDLGLPGMKVLQFGFDEIDSEHLPHRVASDIVYYTGTHDNDTAAGWFEKLAPPQRDRVLGYLGSDGAEIHWDMIRAILTSTANLTVIPIQDVLGLDSRSRMNTPGVATGNWEWRLAAEQLCTEAAARLRRLTELSGRLADSSGTRELFP